MNKILTFFTFKQEKGTYAVGCLFNNKHLKTLEHYRFCKQRRKIEALLYSKPVVVNKNRITTVELMRLSRIIDTTENS